MEIHNFPQYSDEWWAIRSKKMTASNAGAIGNCGAGLKTYIEDVMKSHYSKTREEGFSNEHTRRGHDLEDSAGMVYSFKEDIPVKKIGFVTEGEYTGCSPDLLAGDDGLCEIKCLGDKAHFKIILDAKPEKKYLWQCQMQMQICGKKFCDLTFYNPNFDDSLIVFRQLPDKKMVKALFDGYKIGVGFIKAIEEKLGVVS